jgi:hypothetical protein
MEPYLIPALALITLAIVLFVALRSKRKTEERRESEETRKSALARDGDPHERAP